VTEANARSSRGLEAVVVELVTGLWRLGERLAAEPGADPAADADRWRSARRQLQRMVEALADSGIRIEDHRGRPFHPGLTIEVVAYQPTAGLRHEAVIDVERPSVYRDGAVLQRARVIVGTPDGEDGDD
jgi:hypothetical protein